MRSSHLDRDDVLDRVGTLAMAGDSGYALTEHVAGYFGVTPKAIAELVKKNRNELEESGYRSLTGPELREFKHRLSGEPMSQAARVAVFPRRAVLNLAMLMEGNEVAQAVRTWAKIVEMPGCFASGDTMEELHEALEEAIGLYLSTPEHTAQVELLDEPRQVESVHVTEQRVLVC
jgi:predicted RNase H-like HicB family nuclease